MERNAKDKQLLTSGEIQDLIPTACISVQQCGITPSAFAQDSGWFLNGLECSRYCFPVHYSSPWAVCSTSKGPPVLSTQASSHT